MKAEEFAAAVVSVVKNALAPFAERVAAVETRINVLGDVRDRVVGLEVKQATPVPVPAPVIESVDLSPVWARFTALDEQLKASADVRDRLITLEVKSSIPPVVPELPEIPEPVDLGPVLERLSSLEGQLKAIGDVRDRVIAIEVKSAAPVPVSSAVESLMLEKVIPVIERVKFLEDQHDSFVAEREERLKAAAVPPAADTATATAFADMTRELVAIRERLAVVESRAAVPGPPGPPGRDVDPAQAEGFKAAFTATANELSWLRGRLEVVDAKSGVPGPPGPPGKDGIVKLEGLKWIQEDERTLVAKTADGVEIGTAVLPYPLYRGVYIDGKAYESGDEVTWGGSVWHANKSTVNERPGEGSRSWTLKVKRGRDGKDGLNGKDASLPVVKAQ